MLLAELVATSDTVASTRARSEKVAALADLLRRLEGDEVEAAVGFLIGDPRQGRIGVGYRSVFAVEVTPSASPTLPVLEVDAILSDLAGLSGPGSGAARTASLTDLFGRATATEADFLRRLLVGELRQGALEGVMGDAVAKAAEVPATAVRRAAMFAGDLRAVARLALAGGRDALDAIGLTVGRPVLPMLAATADSVESALAEVGLASVEWKLDGARIQAHRAGDDVGLFTRNLNDVTARLPGIVALVRALPVRAVVLDGEAIGVADDERPDAFQDTMSRFGTQDGVAGAGLIVRFFDVLHADGADLVDQPLSERLTILDSVAGPFRVPGIITDDPAVAAAFTAEALALGHEGVMVKAAGSTYEAGRRGSAWWKVKPVVTLDLVVLAAEWGHGRRRGWLSNIHLGARDPAGGFVMVGKTFKGMTDELLRWQTDEFQARAVADRGHVVELRPELVVEVALDGVQASTRYAGGVALRFARVKRYRPDKTPAEADTIDAVRALLHRG